LQSQNPSPPVPAGPAREQPPKRFSELVYSIHREVINEVGSDYYKLQKQENADRPKLEQDIRRIAEQLIDTDSAYVTRNDREDIINQVMHEVFDLGPITPLLKDESISEIMVNGPGQVYVERRGKLEQSNITFRDNDHLLNIIERIIAPLGRRLDESMPMVDARLPDGSRVNAIIPPLAIKGCVFDEKQPRYKPEKYPRDREPRHIWTMGKSDGLQKVCQASHDTAVHRPEQHAR
jgi:pilus assembly protein CpaF